MRLFITADTADSVVAAVQCGADAVIVRVDAGGSKVTLDQLPSITEYCRNRGVDTILRMERPVFDSNITEELRLCAAAAKAGVNGAFISDLGMYRAARQLLPDFPFFADIGFDMHSSDCVECAERLGFELVLISRELYIPELNAISQKTNIQFLMLSDNYAGVNINDLKTIRKLNLLIDCKKPANPEYVAAITELYASALASGKPVDLTQLEALTDAELPVSAIRAGLINIERRDVLLIKRPKYKGGVFDPPSVMPWEHHALPRVNVKVKSVDQLSRAIAKMQPGVVYIPVDELLSGSPALTDYWDDHDIEICAVTPPVLRDGQLNEELNKLRDIRSLHVSCVAISNIGHYKTAASFGFKVRAAAQINVSNSQTIQMLSELKYASCELQPRLSSMEIAGLYKYIDCEINYRNHNRAGNPGLWSILVEFDDENQRECAGIIRRILS